MKNEGTIMYKFIFLLVTFFIISFLWLFYNVCLEIILTSLVEQRHEHEYSYQRTIVSIFEIFTIYCLIVFIINYTNIGLSSDKKNNNNDIEWLNSKTGEINNCRDSLQVINTFNNAEIAASLMKVHIENKKPQVNIYCYSNGLLRCQINTGDCLNYYNTLLNQEKLQELLGAFENVVNKHTYDTSYFSKDKIYGLTTYSKNLLNKKTCMLSSLQNSDTKDLVKKLNDAFPILVQIL